MALLLLGLRGCLCNVAVGTWHANYNHTWDILRPWAHKPHSTTTHFANMLPLVWCKTNVQWLLIHTIETSTLRLWWFWHISSHTHTQHIHALYQPLFAGKFVCAAWSRGRAQSFPAGDTTLISLFLAPQGPMGGYHGESWTLDLDIVSKDTVWTWHEHGGFNMIQYGYEMGYKWGFWLILNMATRWLSDGAPIDPQSSSLDTYLLVIIAVAGKSL